MAKAPRTSKPKAAAPAAAPAATAPAPTQASIASDDPLGDGSDYGVTPLADDRAPEGGALNRVLVASVSPQGRRRAGQGFGPQAVELSVSDATLALLEGDPQLIVKRG